MAIRPSKFKVEVKVEGLDEAVSQISDLSKKLTAYEIRIGEVSKRFEFAAESPQTVVGVVVATAAAAVASRRSLLGLSWR